METLYQWHRRIHRRSCPRSLSQCSASSTLICCDERGSLKRNRQITLRLVSSCCSGAGSLFHILQGFQMGLGKLCLNTDWLQAWRDWRTQREAGNATLPSVWAQVTAVTVDLHSIKSPFSSEMEANEKRYSMVIMCWWRVLIWCHRAQAALHYSHSYTEFCSYSTFHWKS